MICNTAPSIDAPPIPRSRRLRCLGEGSDRQGCRAPGLLSQVSPPRSDHPGIYFRATLVSPESPAFGTIKPVCGLPMARADSPLPFCCFGRGERNKLDSHHDHQNTPCRHHRNSSSQKKKNSFPSIQRSLATPSAIMISTFALGLLLLLWAPVAIAQSYFAIDPNSVPASIKCEQLLPGRSPSSRSQVNHYPMIADWCVSQMNACNILCTNQGDSGTINECVSVRRLQGHAFPTALWSSCPQSPPPNRLGTHAFPTPRPRSPTHASAATAICRN